MNNRETITRFPFFFFLAIVCTLIITTCSKDEVPEVEEPEVVIEKPETGTITDSILHDNLNRSYIAYVPGNYTHETDVPLVINMHGLGSQSLEQMLYGDFREISDREGFIVVHPQGTLVDGVTHWNVGGFTQGSTVDDLGFIENLIDSLSAIYKIDADRIYATGMSNGGYMSYLLACQLGDRIAAIASVTGSMTPYVYDNCNPDHPTPILQFHGTDDDVVPFNGNAWSKSMDEVMEYWVEQNGCDTPQWSRDLEDKVTTDGSTVEHLEYFGCNKEVETGLYKIDGGGHTWPGTSFKFPGTNDDINASEIIWEFFSEYTLSGLQN